jgi:hypothetical protein
VIGFAVLLIVLGLILLGLAIAGGSTPPASDRPKRLVEAVEVPTQQPHTTTVGTAASVLVCG